MALRRRDNLNTVEATTWAAPSQLGAWPDDADLPRRVNSKVFLEAAPWGVLHGSGWGAPLSDGALWAAIGNVLRLLTSFSNPFVPLGLEVVLNCMSSLHGTPRDRPACKGRHQHPGCAHADDWPTANPMPFMKLEPHLCSRHLLALAASERKKK